MMEEGHSPDDSVYVFGEAKGREDYHVVRHGISGYLHSHMATTLERMVSKYGGDKKKNPEGTKKYYRLFSDEMTC